MSVKRVRKRLSLTSLIDVIFLLLLFFMLSSSFSKFGEVDLSSGGQGRPLNHHASTKPVIIQLRHEEMTVNGSKTELAGLTQKVQTLSGDPVRGQLIVSLKQGVTSERLIQVMHQLRQIPDAKLVVLN